jgi:hypothetical protein
LNHGARPVSYQLARVLDYRNWLDSEPHVLDWDAVTQQEASAA